MTIFKYSIINIRKGKKMAKFEVNDSVNTVDLPGEEGKCPYCGSENIDFHGPDVQDGDIFYDCDCGDCENSYKEWYTLTFDTLHGYPLKEKGTE